MNGYPHRAARHLSASMFLWVPLAVCLYVAQGIIPVDLALNLALAVFIVVVLRALWRARGPAVHLAASRELVITNPWRTYRLRVDSVRGYAWVSPPWTGRDSAPVLGLVTAPVGAAGERTIRIATLSGDDALVIMHSLHIPDASGRAS
jgi:hypothetical protein